MNLLIAMDSGLTLRRFERLQHVVSGLQGTYQTYFHYVKPQCQGLMVSYDPERTKASAILEGLRQHYPEQSWIGCHPNERCAKCGRPLLKL